MKTFYKRQRTTNFYQQQRVTMIKCEQPESRIIEKTEKMCNIYDETKIKFDFFQQAQLQSERRKIQTPKIDCFCSPCEGQREDLCGERSEILVEWSGRKIFVFVSDMVDFVDAYSGERRFLGGLRLSLMVMCQLRFVDGRT